MKYLTVQHCSFNYSLKSHKGKLTWFSVHKIIEKNPAFRYYYHKEQFLHWSHPENFLPGKNIFHSQPQSHSEIGKQTT